ncbi:MAG: DEAD/DEAH box helicase [Candidatus Rokubacteria bacterium]|nr:DEAD/DEAH box helicase [Candidatus Rokubacteria bacterium]
MIECKESHASLLEAPISTDGLLESFRARYRFPLDDFQVRAIEAIIEGQSVIVSAPTGAGKTLVAEFAIHRALARRRRLAYTTPLKALSNQKYADFCRQFGEAHVGILTGDVKVNPRADVLVMTTEILRNMFYTGGLDNLDTVVLDECHYMGDEGRGTVWEEIIVNAPRDVALVALSATVANVTEIADWIGLVHRPIAPVIHPHRPVPLQYLVADLSGEVHTYDTVRQGKVRLLGVERDEGGSDRGRWYTRRVVDPTVMIDELESRGWLPAIYFIFSRAGCERAMETMLAEGKPLLSPDQRREVEVAIAEARAETPTIGESPLNQTIFTALGMGVGLHHAGILPTVKRLIEVLFERGLCRVVFATETMSLGIHMPAKSVVLQSLTKRTDRGFRSLTHNELTQMAGRAGRRGIDPEGKCVIALDARDGLEEMLRVVDGDPEPVVSQFKLGYGSVALLLGTGGDLATIRRTVESSFGQYQNLRRIRGLETEVGTLETALEDARRFPSPCGDFPRIGRYRRLRAEVEAHRMAQGRGARRGPRAGAEAEPGRLALVRRRSGPSLGLICRVDPRRHRVIVSVLLPHGEVVSLKASHIKRVFWATPAINIPRDWERRTVALRSELQRHSVAELLERERRTSPDNALADIECHRCPWGAQPRCDHAWRGLERLEGQLAHKQELLATLRNAYWQEFCRVVDVLRRFGAVQDVKLLAKGQMIAGLRHDNELLVAETVDRGILEDTTLAEAAALTSCFIEESRSGDAAVARLFLRKRPKLQRKLRQLEAVAGEVRLEQRQHHLPMPVGISTGFMPSVFRWASGEDDWSGIVEESFGGHEGDLIRAMRRLIDILRQLAESAEVPPGLAALLGRAARVVDRGIVLESALI